MLFGQKNIKTTLSGLPASLASILAAGLNSYRAGLSAIPLSIALAISCLAVHSAQAEGNFDKENTASWKHLSEGRYIFASAGAAFLDQQIGSRNPAAGTISFSTNHKDKSSFISTVGMGFHVQRYFAIEMSYSYMTGAEYKGTINATNAKFENQTIDGTPSYTEDIYGHMATIALAGTSYDLHDGIGLSIRGGGVVYDLTNEMKLAGSGTLNGAAITSGNNSIKINDAGVSWMAGASVFLAPSLHTRLELRANHMHGLKIKNFNKVSATTAELNYRYRF